MTEFYRKQNDVGDTIVLNLLGVDSLITAVAVVGHVSFNGGTVTNLAGAVTDAVEREVTLQLTPWLATAVVGRHDLDTQVTFGDGSSITWPGKGRDAIIIGAEVG